MNPWETVGRNLLLLLMGVSAWALRAGVIVSLDNTHNKAARVFLYALAVIGAIALFVGATLALAWLSEPLGALKAS